MPDPTNPIDQLMTGKLGGLSLEEIQKKCFIIRDRGDTQVLLTPGTTASVMGKGWSFTTKVHVPGVDLSTLSEREVNEIVDQAVIECEKFRKNVPTYMGGTEEVKPKKMFILPGTRMEAHFMLNLVKEGRITAQISNQVMVLKGTISNEKEYLDAVNQALRRLLVRGEIVNVTASRKTCTDPDCPGRRHNHHAYLTRKGFDVWKERLWDEFAPANKKFNRYRKPKLSRSMWERLMLMSIDSFGRGAYEFDRLIKEA